MMNCNPVTGTCMLPEAKERPSESALIVEQDVTVHYVGDPMCSWCWGISPAVEALYAFCKEEGIEFTLTMGGLRAGGGDVWNQTFKNFLKNEWQHISRVTGQPFSYELLNLSHFEYDTEPACRAVATIELMQQKTYMHISSSLQFFSLIQKKFYTEGKDPKAVNFYTKICEELGIDFIKFKKIFESSDAVNTVNENFMRCRKLGVHSFPSILLQKGNDLKSLSVGYTSADKLINNLKKEVFKE